VPQLLNPRANTLSCGPYLAPWLPPAGVLLCRAGASGFLTVNGALAEVAKSHIGRMLRKIPFIKPMAPTLAKVPPAGPDWLHEVKLDGWRMQLHIAQGNAALYSKNGTDYTKRFGALRDTIESIPVKSAIIDCELVACDDTGMPNFRTLMEMGNKAPALCLWCFARLALDGAR